MMDAMTSFTPQFPEPTPPPDPEQIIPALAEFFEPGNTKVFSSATSRQAIVNKVVEKYNYSKDNLDATRTIWKDIRGAYLGEKTYTVPSGVHSPESIVSPPFMLTQIDKMVQMYTLRLVAPYNNFLTVKDEKTRTRVHKLENFLFNMFVSKSMAISCVKAVSSAAMFGVGITKVIPDYSNQEPSCQVEAVNIFDFYIDPFASSIDDATFIIHRTWIDYDTLMARMKDAGFNKAQCNEMIEWKNARKEKDAHNNPIPVSSLRASSQNRADMTEEEPSDDEKYDRFLIYEYYDGQNIITVGEKQFLLRMVKNSIGYPFQLWFLRIPTAGEFFVKSHGDLLRPIQEEINIKRNQRIENINKIVNAPLMYTPGFITDPKKLIIRSGQKIAVNNLEECKFLEVKNDTDMLLNEIEYLKGEGSDVTSVNAVVQGKAAKTERMTTAETNSLYSQSNMGFDYGSSIMAITGLIPMFQCILRICAFINKGVPAQAPDHPNGVGETTPIFPMELIGTYQISVSVNPNKEQQDREEGMGTYQLFNQDPYIDQVGLRKWVIPRIAPDFPLDLLLDQPNITQPMQQSVSPQASDKNFAK